MEPGLWVERVGDKVFAADASALFLDRDGTVNVDTGYPGDPDGIVLLDDIVPLIAAANARAMPVVIVTNQSGIARGYFGWGDFAAVNRRVLQLLGEKGASVDMVVACAYHEAGEGACAPPTIPCASPILACCLWPPSASAST